MPVDKHDSDKNLPTPCPLGGVRGQTFKFCYNSVSCQYFYGNFACRQRYNKYETYQRWFSIEGLCLTPWVDLGGRVKIQLFQNTVMLHIKFNGITKCSNMVAIILPADPPPPCMPLTRSISQKSTFSENGNVAYQVKWNHEMQQHGSNYFARRPPPPPPCPWPGQ